MEDRYQDIRKHRHIVSCGDTANALGVIRSLGEVGIKPIVVCVKERTHPPMLIKSKYICELHQIEDWESPVDYVIKHFGNDLLKPFVYVCDDTQESEYDQMYDQLKEKFYFFHCGQRGAVNELMNKERICQVAEQCGCRIPKEEVVDTGTLPKNLKYPIITKTLMSIMGAWKNDVYVCHNADELLCAYSKIKSPKLLIQEYIHKKNEVAIMGFSIDGGREICAPYQLSYFRCSDHAYGPYMYFTPLTDKKLLEQVHKVIKACNFSGCFEIEFLVDQDDSLVFLEVNFRYSFWNYSVTYGGINYPLEWARATINNKIDVSGIPLKSYFTAMSEPSDFAFAVSGHRISLGQWLKDLLTADVHYYFNWKDPMPAISFWWHKGLRAIKKRLH